ncbi:MAG: quinone-dependent dihydroorotate dehydrogenase [Rhodoluna sp.]|nr:quinone-dependent dihydroorotate dehydrogenase [Rhodoluna sp.]
MLYKALFKLVFSRLDPEKAHYLGMFVIKLIGFTRLSKFSQFGVRTKSVQVLGLDFAGPFGIAAGFDKNAIAVKELGELGFSHVEIGTVTRHPQPGNPKPRLYRLIKDQALINRMGFNNEGADQVARRLTKLRASGAKLPVIGVNIGKSRTTELVDAVSDYEYSAKALAPVADYIAVNVSSPNTPGLRSLQDIDELEPILVAVSHSALGKPVLVKIAPDLEDSAVVEVAALVRKLGIAGVIATNTTIKRVGLETSAQQVNSFGAGGLSGPVLAIRSKEILVLLRKELGKEFVVISVGGVVNGADVAERLSLGADLVQGYTGFVYQGPLWAKKINGSLRF